LKLATWNVNSLTVRLPQVLDWLAAHGPDVLVLQETKLTDDKFPHQASVPPAGRRSGSGRRPTTASPCSAASRPPTWCATSPASTTSRRA
jgi:hypothetical protein